MDLAPSAEDAEVARTFEDLLSRESTPGRVRRAERLGFDPDLWRVLTSVGVPAMATGPEPATAEQLVIVAELSGRHLASAPVVESLVSARLLERCRSTAAADLLSAAQAGAVTTLSLHPSRAGAGRLIPAGAVARTVLWFDGGALRAGGGDPPMAAASNLGGLPLAERTLAATDVLLTDEGADRFEAARHEWQLLTAAQLIGIAGRALEIGADYARERVIFDQPVATFQTVAHRLADHATAVDGARLLMQEAAWALDTGDPRARALATMAFCFAAERALEISRDALHYHGGYGFTLEYDIQLYYRRARAYPQVWGSVQHEYQALADQLFGADGEAA